MLVIIPCGQQKRTYKTQAERLYIGPYYRQCLRWALSITERENIYILSAKHGFVSLKEELFPYEQQMDRPGAISLTAIKQQAKTKGIDKAKRVVAIGGRRYTNICQAIWPSCECPLQQVSGGMGMQMKWLKENQGRLPDR